MRIIVNDVVVAMVADADGDAAITATIAAKAGHVFELLSKNAGECRFLDLGPRDWACREPINIVWTDKGLDPRWKPISNLAPAAFALDGQAYASVEGFWQGLKFADEAERRRIAQLAGTEAMEAGREAAPIETFTYAGWTYPVGRPEHWALMRKACIAKFAQDAAARTALLDTGERLLTHRTRHDSRTIPGAVMADIWMDVRQGLNRKSGKRGVAI